MRKCFLILLILLSFKTVVLAQDDEEEKKGFKKENLFTGGSISLAFFSNGSLIGANPVFGYSVARWLDAGVIINYNYTNYRDYSYLNDHLRQTVYGGGVFTRLYPIKFLFAQGQVEQNKIQYKYKPAPNSGVSSWAMKSSANSILIGGGYCTGRDPDGKSVYGYLAILFDVSNDLNSPYVDGYGRALPIIRAGLQIPLFQGGRKTY